MSEHAGPSAEQLAKWRNTTPSTYVEYPTVAMGRILALLDEVDRLTTALAQAEESRDMAKVQARGWAEEANALREYAEAERVRANDAEADLRVLREGIKALADTWDHDPDEYHVSLVQASMVAGIRALLGRSS